MKNKVEETKQILVHSFTKKNKKKKKRKEKDNTIHVGFIEKKIERKHKNMIV